MNDRPPRAGPVARHRGRFLLLLCAVLVLHALLGERLGALLNAAQTARATPPRLQAAFVRELQQTAAPLPMAAAAPPVRARPPTPAVQPPAAPASAPVAEPTVPDAALPEPDAALPEPAIADAQPVPPVADPPAVEPPPAQATAAAEPDSAASAAGFVWPPSTRLSYTLGGYVRGEVQGSAQVQWLRSGERYQVHLDVVVGPSFAPLMQRRMSSDGALSAAGLAPRRYDEETQVAFGRTRHATLAFDADGITLASGRRVGTLPAVQDSVSQFVQLTYLFLTGAEPLRAGGRIEVPLALPRRVDHWVYDVVGEELLDTPFGPVPAWHLRPRRAGDASALSIEAWFAPSLQYLPVRIVIRQGGEDHIDLMIERLPQQAGPDAAPR